MIKSEAYDRASEAIDNFESKTGHKPKYLYLGFMEWDDYTSFYSLLHAIEFNMRNNKTLEGIEALYVPKMHHLGVGD